MASTYPFYKDEKMAAFIDGAYLYTISRNLDFDIDYKKLLGWMHERSHLVRANYYTLLFEDQDYSPVKPLVDWLDYNGFTMVTKTAREESGSRRRRSSIDVDLAVDAMDLADHIDHVLLFVGDSDYRKLIEVLRSKGVRVSVFGTIRTGSPLVADELRRMADFFYEMEDLIEVIGRDGGYDADYDAEYPEDDTESGNRKKHAVDA